MNSTYQQPAADDARRMHASREELAERIARAVPEDGPIHPMDGLRLHRATAPTELGHGVSYPALCVIARGSKETRVGNRTYRYDADHYLVATAALPYATQITEASKERPYLALVLRLDPLVVGSVMVETGQPAPRGSFGTPAFAVSPLDADVLDATLRIVRLLDTPADQRILLPLITREIVYRLLVGEQGGLVRHLATLGGETNRIASAIERLRAEFDQPIRIDALAQELGMSVSGFHHHFKQATAMSPLQFQKQLRLQEARRLMLSEDFDATTAGLRVGYDDTSHFSREYKRLFGEPPLRDIARLRNASPGSAPM
ncbi:MAG: AraC family transcriptional regulator [Thermomicrobiales bacterium]|nr:AraC family transcriptional regulator [Thermomicrobiales bacterium]MCO5221452.1 AraC family transcriptional regulator [Thermomicrobiales bacterium]